MRASLYSIRFPGSFPRSSASIPGHIPRVSAPLASGEFAFFILGIFFGTTSRSRFRVIRIFPSSSVYTLLFSLSFFPFFVHPKIVVFFLI